VQLATVSHDYTVHIRDAGHGLTAAPRAASSDSGIGGEGFPEEIFICGISVSAGG